MIWLTTLVTLQVSSGQEDAVKWHMGRQQGEFRIRPVEDHVPATQGLENLDRYLQGDILRMNVALNSSVPLLATFSKGPSRYECKGAVFFLGKEQEIGKKKEGRRSQRLIAILISGEESE